MTGGHVSAIKPESIQEAIEHLVWANRILANENIFDYLGHVSVRNSENPDTFLLARAIAPESVVTEDILEVDHEGKVVTKSDKKPYTERIIHSAIYSHRPDVNSVIHAHPVPVVTLSVSQVPFRVVSYQASVFYEGVPIYEGYDFVSPTSTGMLIQTKEEGERIAATLGGAMAMMLWGHGCNVVGKSLPHAVQNIIALRDNCAMLLVAHQYGNVKSLSYDQAKVAAGVMLGLAGAERAWNAWVSRVKKAMPDMS
jgi:3-hydroxy-2-methylpyridine-4,5-dicarboxylate 4-decarboxylase